MNKINGSNVISAKIINITRIVLGCIVLYSFVMRIAYPWNKDVPAILYFTVQSNLLLGLYFIVTSIFPKIRYNKATHAIALYMVIVGFIFILVLDEGFVEKIYINLGNKKISEIVHYISMTNSMITHYLMPFIAFLDYIVLNDTRNEKLKYSYLIYPSAYFVTTMTFGLTTGKHVYPFFDPSVIGGYAMILVVLVGLFLIFILFSKAMYKINCRTQNSIEKYYDRIIAG